jgi:hypothetical protein
MRGGSEVRYVVCMFRMNIPRSLIKPFMEQAAADMAYTRRVADHDEGTSDGDPLFVYPRHKKGGGGTTTTDLSAADCCICMDSRVQVMLKRLTVS